MADEDVQVERDGRVLRVTLNRPARLNALSRAVLAQVRSAFERHRDDPDLACVVLAAAGDRYFAAGGDLDDLGQVRSDADVRHMLHEARVALDAVRNFPLPVMAVLNGDAIGGGAELAVACDTRLMRSGTHIGYVHGQLAITSAWGGGTDLVSLVGPARALRMMARCELVPADLALQWGLADAVAPAAGLAAAVQSWIEPMLTLTGAVLRGAKAQVLAARRGASFDERRGIEQACIERTWIDPDHWAAVERVRGRRNGG